MITTIGRTSVLLAFGWLFLSPGAQHLCAQDEAPADTIFTASVPYPRIPLPQPILFPEKNPGLSLADRDSLLLPRIPIPLPNIQGFQRVEQPDSTGQQILISEEYYNKPVSIPIRMSYEQYFALRRKWNARQLFIKATTQSLQYENKQGGRGLELVGAEIAGQRVSLRVAGNVNINARAMRENKNLISTSLQNRPTTNILFNQRQNFNIEGRIGDRINVLVDYNSERDFQFENDVKINYTGNEDDIVQRIDAGNISLSLPGTQLVTFSPNSKGLFGIRTDMKIGPIDVVTVASIEQGKKQKLKYQSGSSEQNYSTLDYQYIKNRYFFLSDYYRENFYPLRKDNNLHYALPENKIIKDIEVYKSVVGVNTEVGSQIPGVAWVDPNDKSIHPEAKKVGEFRLLKRNEDYEVNEDLGFIRLDNVNLQDTEILAVAYSTVGGDSVGNVVFNPDVSDSITLKLLRPDNPQTTDPTWDLMFKNVYSLGAFDLDPDNLDFNIVDTYTNNNSKTTKEGVSWLRIFGLDRFNSSNEPKPDDKLDNSPAIFDKHRGEIFIPYLEPFRSSQEAAAAGLDTFPGLYNPNLPDTSLSQKQMYDGSYSTNNQKIQKESKFELDATYANQSSVINLGGFVIEGSEEVKLDGRTLKKGTDYTVDYFLGQIKILNQDALKPGADLEISYESNQVFQLDKKVVIGGRAEYKFGNNSFLAATGMYYSKSSIDDKVRVGQEPFSNFVWDVNGRYEHNLNFVTRAIDYLPLVRTEEPSHFQVEGEVAQVLPNPNTQNSNLEKNGVAYIDDFEGSKRTTTLTVFRGNWTESSLPEGMRRDRRGFLFWYNPYGGVATKNIWPDKQTSVRLGNNTTDVMNLVLDPKRAIGDAIPTLQDSIWGGIMRPLPSSYRDQTESKYVEIWMRGKTGNVHLDLGRISEDINGNNRLDGEDKNQTIKTGYVKPEDDLGYDLLPDKDEVGVYNGDTLRYNSPASLFEKYGLLDKDPAGDNFKYSSGSFSARQQYRYINGTQGNSALADGNRVDTEDINGNNILDVSNNYFSYVIPVDTLDNKYFVSETQFDDGTPTGWKQYRIPLSDFTKMVGSPQMDDIQFARLWLSDFPYTDGNQDTVSIARIEIVGNEWINNNTIKDVLADTSRTDSSFSVTVINNEDNPEYNSPPGVHGARDRVNNITSKEQSLVLKMSNFDQWYEGNALKQFIKGQENSYVNYRHMKMFLHGDPNASTENHIEFFYRFGLNENNYYEYNTRLDPGWQEMDIDLDFLSRLKTVDSLTVKSGSPFPANNPKGYIYFNKNTITFEDTTTGRHEQLIVHGQPSLRKIAQLEVGARNYTNQDYQLLKQSNTMGNWPAYSGEIWINELRVSGVSRTGGRAMRVRASMDFADLASINISASKMDADFHRVDAQWGDQNNTEGIDLNGTFNAHKFLPESWGLSIPIRGKYSQRLKNPKYLPGSDVLTANLDQTLPAEVAADTLKKIQTFSMNRSYGFSVAKRSRSDNWFVKYSLDAVKFSYDVSSAYSRNELNKYIRNTTTATQGSYNAQLPQGKPFSLFKFLRFLPWYGKDIAESKFSYLPTKVDISAALSERIDSREGRYGAVDKKTSSSYTQVLRRQFATGYNPFNSLNLTFNKSVTSNVSDFRGARRWDMVKYLKPGIITQATENYGANYNLKLANWLNPTFRYQSNYNYSYQIGSDVNAINAAYNQRLSMNVTLDLKQINQSIGRGSTNRGRPGGARGRPTTGRPGRPTSTNGANGKDQGEKKESKSLSDIFDSFLTNIQPINLTMNAGRQGQHNNLIHSPDIAYRMGLKVDANVPVDSLYQDQAGNRSISTSRDMSVRSGYNFSRNLSATFNFGRGTSESFRSTTTTKQLQEDYILFQFSDAKYDLRKNFIKGLPLPGWSVRWSGLESLPIFSKFAQSVSLEHTFSGKFNAQWKNGEQQGASYTQNLQPLVGLRFQLQHDISLNTSYGTTKKVTEQFVPVPSVDISTQKSFSLSAGYQRRKGMHIPLPFFKDLNLDNNINFTFTFDYNKSLSKQKQGEGSFEVRSNQYSWQVQPKIDYSFTSKVTGGIYYKFGRRFNETINSKPTKFSDFGLTVNIQIRG